MGLHAMDAVSQIAHGLSQTQFGNSALSANTTRQIGPDPSECYWRRRGMGQGALLPLPSPPPKRVRDNYRLCAQDCSRLVPHAFPIPSLVRGTKKRAGRYRAMAEPQPTAEWARCAFPLCTREGIVLSKAQPRPALTQGFANIPALRDVPKWYHFIQCAQDRDFSFGKN